MGETTRTSVLASLTKEVMADKTKAAAVLTPVEGEGRPAEPLPVTKAMFPNDMPTEVVQQKASELTRIIGHLTEARDALLTLVDAPVPSEVVDLDAERKAREKEADEKAAETQANFNADFAAKAAAAQEATFGWLCPDHGKAIEKVSPKTQKPFIGCPECNKFQR